MTLEPILDYLRSRGFAMEGEYIMIGGWPVQFLAPNSPLVEEALEQAIDVHMEGERARVFQAEHLAAIACRLVEQRTNRAFCSSSKEETSTAHEILKRNDLVDAWSRFEQHFLNTP